MTTTCSLRISNIYPQNPPGGQGTRLKLKLQLVPQTLDGETVHVLIYMTETENIRKGKRHALAVFHGRKLVLEAAVLFGPIESSNIRRRSHSYSKPGSLNNRPIPHPELLARALRGFETRLVFEKLGPG